MKRKNHIILHMLTLLISVVFLSSTYNEAILAVLRHDYILFTFLGIAPSLMLLCSSYIIFGFLKNPEFNKEHKYLVKTSFFGILLIMLSIALVVVAIFFIRGEAAIGFFFSAYFIVASEFIIIFVLMVFSCIIDNKNSKNFRKK